MTDIERYHAAIAYLDGLLNLPNSDDYMSGKTDPSVFLKRTREFLGAIGNPHEGFKYVHIAGTAGKGTVTTMVHDALLASGKNVGSFTSPYVTAAIEKIRVGELYIVPEEFADIVYELKPHIDDAHFHGRWGRPSYFEIFFAIALIYFKKKKCEWVVLEVGAGGRHDATNIIENPAVTAVTNIDYDHVQILGKTLISIADNKIGIVKKGSEFFTTEKRPALLKLFQRRCKDAGARFNALPVRTDYMENNKRLARAICAYIGLREDVSEQAINATKLPCRFEVIAKKPHIILDGAHNRAKMRSTVSNLRTTGYKRLHLIIGISAMKDADVIMKEIIPLADSIYITSFDRPGVISLQPEELLQEVNRHAKKSAEISMYQDPERALDAALKKAGGSDAILATGSFYMCGSLRERWYSEEWVLKNRKSFR